MNSATVSVAEFYNQMGAYPASNAEAGLVSPTSIVGNYVTQVDVAGQPGIIESTFGGDASEARPVERLSAVGEVSEVPGPADRDGTVLVEGVPAGELEVGPAEVGWAQRRPEFPATRRVLLAPGERRTLTFEIPERP